MKNFFIPFILFSFIIAGCSRNEITEEKEDEKSQIEHSSVNAVPLSKMSDVSFEDLSDEYVYIAVTMISPNEGEELFFRAKTRALGSEQYLSMVDSLPIGHMVIDCIFYKGEESSEREGEYNIVVKPIGMEIELTDMDLYLIGDTGDDPAYFEGEGTKDSPYLIQNSTDLLALKLLINDPEVSTDYDTKWYKQTVDIDMSYVCNYENAEYGWLPIGETSAQCFKGHYLGDGHVIRNLKVNRINTVGVGLFGFVYMADIENLTITESSILGAGAAGAFAGAVVGEAGDIMTSDTGVLSLFLECKVSDTPVEAAMTAGGLIGAADANSKVVIQNCTAEESVTVSGIVNTGGIIGGGFYTSGLVITTCNNYATVNCTKLCAGGIVGTADTAIIFNCNNFASVSITETMPNSTDYNDVDVSSFNTMAAGGILGGGSQVQIVACINEAPVTGFRAVGGIAGSALVTEGSGTEDDPGVYNTILMAQCVNTASVTGTEFVGGLAGEAQASVLESANFGRVTSTGNNAGGLVGYAPVSGFSLSYNAAEVTGDSRVGGICGATHFSSTYLTHNYADVASNGGYAGGIFGKGGNNVLVNYCGNFGNISSSQDNNPVGGLVGELGKPKVYDDEDIVDMFFAVFLAVVKVASYGVTQSFAVRNMRLNDGLPGLFTVDGGMMDFFAKPRKAATIANIVVQAVSYSADAVCTIAFKDRSAQILYSGVDYADISNQMAQRCEQISSELSSRSTSYMNSAQFSLPANISQVDLLDGQVSNYENMYNFFHSNLMDDTQSEKTEALSENLNIRRGELAAEAEAEQHERDLITGITKGILTALSIGLMISSWVVTGPAAIIGVAAAQTVVAVGTASTSLAETITTFEDNSAEVSQCFNYGDVSGGSTCGGVIGFLSDNAYVEDSYNLGSVTFDNEKKRGGIVGSAGNSISINRNYSINANISELYGSDGMGQHEINDNFIYTQNDPAISDPSTYTNWDFSLAWNSPWLNESSETVPPVVYKTNYYVFSE